MYGYVWKLNQVGNQQHQIILSKIIIKPIFVYVRISTVIQIKDKRLSVHHPRLFIIVSYLNHRR